MVIKKIVKEKKIGKVTHYFGKIKVAAIKFSQPMSIGDSIRIIGGNDTNFKMKISSIQFMGEKINKSKKGQEVAIKVRNKVREGYKVFKLEA
jgi:putative protease